MRFTRSFYVNTPFPAVWHDRFVSQVLDHFRISHNAKIRRLSNGQRAQVSLALAFAPDPDLLILDDPTLGLDTVVRRDFLESIIHLDPARGSHDLLQLAHPGRRRARGRPDRHPGRRRVARRLSDRSFQVRRSGAWYSNSSARAATFRPARAWSASGKSAGDWNWSWWITGPNTPRWPQALGATSIEVLEMNLEDAFIAYTRGETSPLPTMEWEVAR